MLDEANQMKLRVIILYWLLLLVPTLIIGAAGVLVLRDEEERLIQVQRSSARDRATAIADSVQITVEAVERNLAAALFRIPRTRVVDTLLYWKDTNPLIRNVFAWTPKEGLLYPETGVSATRDETRFIVRYEALFSGRVPWTSNASSTLEIPRTPDSGRYGGGGRSQSQSRPGNRGADPEGFRSARRGLQDLARVEVKGYPQHGDAREAASNVPQDGWIPWFSDNKLHILGWCRRAHDNLIYGVELELVTLLSRLVVDFPKSFPKGSAYALMDDNGSILHQAGDFSIQAGTKPDVVVSLAPHLPHWQIAVYFAQDISMVGAGRSFVIFSGLLLGIFVIAIVVGGTLLTRQAYRNWQDAQRKSSFVSNVSHELKTPLTSIRMYAELLSENRIADPDKRRRYLDVIVSESQRLGRLVNNVLNFSRLDQGRMKYHPEELDVTSFLHEIVDEQRLQVEAAGMRLRKQIPAGEIRVYTDRDALKQAIINTMDNAVKYASDGGELTITLETRHGYGELCIMDRGPGVPESHRKTIFDTFHRVDDSLTTKRPGVGLGLTIARRILRDLGGDLRHQPRTGGGSCFTLLLPLGDRGTQSHKGVGDP